MVQTLAPQRPDDAFGDGVCLRRVNRGGDGIDPDPSGPLAEVTAIHGISIAQQMAWLVTPRCRFDHLAPHPGGGRVGRHVDVRQLPPTVGDELGRPPARSRRATGLFRRPPTEPDVPHFWASGSPVPHAARTCRNGRPCWMSIWHMRQTTRVLRWRATITLIPAGVAAR